MMKYIKSPKVYCCCGKYYATDKQTQDKEIICQSCKQKLTAPVKTPYIYVIEN